MNRLNDSGLVPQAHSLTPNAQRPALYRIINFAVKHGHGGGSLVQFQQGAEESNALPFPIGKVLVTSGMKSDDVRGNHAHHETEEIVVALAGGCTFELDDGRGTQESVRLSSKAERVTNAQCPAPNADVKDALLLFPHVWRTFHGFEPDTVLLVVANMKYDEMDYIRDRAEFERLAKTWVGLGGSSAHGAD